MEMVGEAIAVAKRNATENGIWNTEFLEGEVENRNAKKRCLEILKFQHFAKFTTFTTNGDDFRNGTFNLFFPTQ